MPGVLCVQCPDFDALPATRLTRIDLHQLRDPVGGLDALAHLPLLRSLTLTAYFSNGRKEPTCFADISKLTQLTALSVDPQRRDKTMNYVTGLTGLLALQLAYKLLPGPLAGAKSGAADGAAKVGGAVRATHSFPWVPPLGHLYSLTHLALGGLRHLRDVADVAELTSLRYLKIECDHTVAGEPLVRADGCPSFLKLTALTELVWDYPHLTGLGHLTALQKLLVHSAVGSGGGAEEGLSRLAKLRELAL